MFILVTVDFQSNPLYPRTSAIRSRHEVALNSADKAPFLESERNLDLPRANDRTTKLQ